MIFCTYTRTEGVGKLITVSLNLMYYHGVKSRYLVVFAVSYYIRNVFIHGVFFHTISAKNEILCSRLRGKIQRVA